MSESPISMSGLVCGVKLAINVRDMENARRWYADKLGIVFDEARQASICGVSFELWEFSTAVPASHVVYQFVTPHLAQAHARLAECGVAVTAIDWECMHFDLTDPDGNQFVFYTPKQWIANDMAR